MTVFTVFDQINAAFEYIRDLLQKHTKSYRCQIFECVRDYITTLLHYILIQNFHTICVRMLGLTTF